MYGVKQYPADLVPIDLLDIFVDAPVTYTDAQGNRFTSTHHLIKFFSDTAKMRQFKLQQLERSQKLLQVKDVL